LEGPGSIILADIVTDNRSHVPNTDWIGWLAIITDK
jgi:hypothetical protein